MVHNSVSGPTNPYDIHEILLQQKPAVDGGYDFLFAMKALTAKRRAMPAAALAFPLGMIDWPALELLTPSQYTSEFVRLRRKVV